MNPSSPHNLNDTSSPTEDTSKCICFQWELPPPKPSALPFPATEENYQKLENWLKSYYASSTFNTCSHQSLPMMNTKPLCLMIDPNATLVAHHTIHLYKYQCICRKKLSLDLTGTCSLE